MYPSNSREREQSWQSHRNGPFTYSFSASACCVISSVTSWRACSIFPFDSARMLLFTVSCALSDAVPTTSIDPQTLSISSVRRAAPAGIANVFSIFSCSCSVKFGSSWSISSRSTSSWPESASISGSSRSASMSTCGYSMSISISVPTSASTSGSISMSTSTAGDFSSCADRSACFSGTLRAACAGNSSKAIPDASTERKYVLLIRNSSIQLADRPVRPLAHRRIQVWRLPQFLKPRSRLRIAPFHQLIDQRNLHQRRLLLLQSVHYRFLHLRLPGVPAQRIQRRQPYVHALVVPQRMHQRRKHLRIELPLAPRPRHALQPFARRLLLQHRQRHHLPHVGQLRMHRRQIPRIRFRAS